VDDTSRRVTAPSRGASNSSGDQRECMQGERRPKTFSLHVCISTEGKMCLRQTRCADMPDASDPFASRLARTRIT
jgi:hypothetical protein